MLCFLEAFRGFPSKEIPVEIWVQILFIWVSATFYVENPQRKLAILDDSTNIVTGETQYKLLRSGHSVLHCTPVNVYVVKHES